MPGMLIKMASLFDSVSSCVQPFRRWRHRWSKDFLEAGKKRLAGDTARVGKHSGELAVYRADAARVAQFDSREIASGLLHRHSLPSLRDLTLDDLQGLSSGRNVGLLLVVLSCEPLVSGYRRLFSNGGALEHAQEMAAHESPRTTKLYDRTKERLTQDEVERIRF
jgi:hypothetical protein